MKKWHRKYTERKRTAHLAEGYYQHHFGCAICVRAGINPQLRRCKEGEKLFNDYSEAVK